MTDAAAKTVTVTTGTVKLAATYDGTSFAASRTVFPGDYLIGTGSGNIKPGGEPGSPINKPIIEVLDNATDKDIRPVVGTYYYTKDTGELWYYNQDRMWDLLISSSGQMMVWEDMQ